MPVRLDALQRLREQVQVEERSEHKPARLVLISEGRSGSTPVALSLAGLTGSPPSMKTELLGSNGRDMLALATKSENAPLEKVVRFYASERAAHPNAGLVGFKLKPYDNRKDAAAYMHVYHWIATRGIPVVYLFRNPLFVIVSGAKHTAFPNLAAHCKPKMHGGEAACLAQHANATFELETGNSLRAHIDAHYTKRDEHLAILNQLNVSYLYVSFESLFILPDKIEAWRRVLRFLQPSNSTYWEHIAMEDVERTFATESTSHVPLSQRLINYDAVCATLAANNLTYLLNKSNT